MNESELVRIWTQLEDSLFKKTKDWVTSPDCLAIVTEYNNRKDSMDDFNVFRLVSDIYYRENFHSDIIGQLLNPHGNHGEGNKFLRLFIKLIKAIKPEINISLEDYDDAVVTREEGRIDILIKTAKTKRAVLIENKINNAGDMPRQLPRYKEYLDRKYYDVDAIVYLPLDDNKNPSMDDWSNEDKTKIKPLLVILPAYDKSGKLNLVDNWLYPSELTANRLDIISTIKQYAELVKTLNNNIMDMLQLEKFYDMVLSEEQMKTAKSVRELLNNLPSYMAWHIKNMYLSKCSPFSDVWIYNNRVAVFEEGLISDVPIVVDVACSEEGYDVDIFTRDSNRVNDFLQIKDTVTALCEHHSKREDNSRITRHFDFTNENGLCEFIDSLLSELKERKEKMK